MYKTIGIGFSNTIIAMQLITVIIKYQLPPDKINGIPERYAQEGTYRRTCRCAAGNWQIKNGKNGSIIYQLNDDRGNGFIYLLKVDERILLFTDADGKLLVGNEDFSYTMNSIVKP